MLTALGLDSASFLPAALFLQKGEGEAATLGNFAVSY